MNRVENLWDIIKCSNISMMAVTAGEKKEQKDNLKK